MDTISIYNQKNDNEIDFTIKTDAFIANSLRRVMIDELFTYAIEYVNMEENSGVMPDEMIAHRIGLCPLKIDENSEEISEDEDENEDGIYEFELDIEFDKEKSVNGVYTVYSKDIVCKNSNSSMVYDDIIITKLISGQKIKLTATAIKGNGLEHSKWSPSCGTTYEKNGNIFKFHVESTGSLTSNEIVLNSIQYIRDRLDNL